MFAVAGLDIPLVIGDITLPSTARMQLQKFEGPLKPLEFLDVVNVPKVRLLTSPLPSPPHHDQKKPEQQHHKQNKQTNKQTNEQTKRHRNSMSAAQSLESA